MSTKTSYDEAWGGEIPEAPAPSDAANDDFAAGWKEPDKSPVQLAQNTLKNILGGPDPSGASAASQRGMLQNGIGDPADQWSYDQKKPQAPAGMPPKGQVGTTSMGNEEGAIKKLMERGLSRADAEAKVRSHKKDMGLDH